MKHTMVTAWVPRMYGCEVRDVLIGTSRIQVRRLSPIRTARDSVLQITDGNGDAASWNSIPKQRRRYVRQLCFPDDYGIARRLALRLLCQEAGPCETLEMGRELADDHAHDAARAGDLRRTYVVP